MCPQGGHIGGTWRIRLNHLSAAVIRHCGLRSKAPYTGVIELVEREQSPFPSGVRWWMKNVLGQAAGWG